MQARSTMQDLGGWGGVCVSQTFYLPNNPLGLLGDGESNLPYRDPNAGGPRSLQFHKHPRCSGCRWLQSPQRHTSVELVQGGPERGGCGRHVQAVDLLL